MNFGEMPDHIRKRHSKDIPSLGSLDDIQLPASTMRYPDVEIMATRVARDAVLDSSAKLDELTDKALRFYDDLLSEPMSTDDMKLLSAQADAARTILTTQLRVDDSRLKKRTNDTLALLLKRMEEEDARLTINA
jgi:hypothetical protein